MDDISMEDLRNVLTKFSKHMYRARDHDSKDEEMLQKCINLFSRDYLLYIIKNDNGELTSHYPRKLIVLDKEKNELNPSPNQSDESELDSNRVRELMLKAKNARCRARFPIPVILFDGKSICRSGTLSGGPEIYGRSGYDFLFSGPENQAEDSLVDDNRLTEDERYVEDDGLDEVDVPQTKSDWQLFTKVRNQDIRLLKSLNVKYIVDLMVEKKKVKFGFNVTSSEKVDKENRYSDFTILSLPYPGCEFFNEFRNRNHSGTGLVFDWNQPFVDATLSIPHDNISPHVCVDWNEYKRWDLIQLTKNYLKLILRYIVEGKGGLLIHCISGWDRTPLYVSLVRLSLWADGKIHTSLGPREIIYITMVYDWYFFGHNLCDRLCKGEEIFLFCFYMLKHIVSDQFSIQSIADTIKPNLRRNESDHLIDSVLLESSLEGGSSTSLSSIGSTTSNRSSIDGIPGANLLHPYSSHSSNNSEANSHSSRTSATAHIRSQCPNVEFPSPIQSDACRQELGDSCKSDTSTTTTLVSCKNAAPTLPVPVPKKGTGNEVFVSNGSWQVISESGSFRGTAMMSIDSTNSYDWPPSISKSGDSYGHSCDSNKPTSRSSRKKRRPSTPNPRKTNLNSVREIFNIMYRNAISAESSGVSYIFDQISEKIGLRLPKNAATSTQL